MKNTDLMIGDWVHCITDNVNHRIDSFGTDDRTEVYGKPWYISDGKFNILDDVESIPLTPEILEKNGWKKYKNKRWMYFKDGCDEFNILLENNSTEIEYLNMIYNPEDNAEVNYGSNFEFPRKIYVHELQHILKLCGIEKEIVL